MTLRDLTDEQGTLLRQIAARRLKERNKSRREDQQFDETMYNLAFSDGVIAVLQTML